MATIITSGIDLHWWSSKKIQNSLASWTAWDLVNFRKSILTSYLCYVMLCYVMLCILYLKSMHKIVYDKKLVNIDWLMLQSLQETKCDALLLLLLLNLLRQSSSNNNYSNNKKRHSSSMRIAPERVDCVSARYSKFLYAYKPHI